MPVVDHLGELAHVGADRQVGVIDPAEFVGVGVDVDERLAGMVGRDQRVAVGRRLAEARADGEDQIGVADALLQFGVGAVAEVAGIDAAAIVDRVLAAEGGGDREFRGGRRNWRNGAPRAGSSRRRRRSRPGAAASFSSSNSACTAPGSGSSASGGTRRAVGDVDLVAQHVLGQREHHRARPAGGGDAIGARDIFGDAPRVVDPRRPFGDRARRRRGSRFPGSPRGPCRRARRRR